jgi:hypothetical protein
MWIEWELKDWEFKTGISSSNYWLWWENTSLKALLKSQAREIDHCWTSFWRLLVLELLLMLQQSHLHHACYSWRRPRGSMCGSSIMQLRKWAGYSSCTWFCVKQKMWYDPQPDTTVWFLVFPQHHHYDWACDALQVSTLKLQGSRAAHGIIISSLCPVWISS